MATRAVKPLLFIIVILIFPVIVHSGQFNCIRVTDGDTITVATDGQKHTIRLVGIDAPEKSHGKHKPGQPFSQSSTKHIAGLVLNKPVDIVSYGTDQYGRTLGVVYVDGKNVNLEMVRAGLAEVYRGRPAKGFDKEPYQKAEDAARRAGVGMWSLGDKYISPKEWRRTNR
jgi:endonuclease YncB( thermonuclease family)